MIIIDMPLKELKEYKGISSRPKDFEEFWEKALGEMREMGTDYKLERSEYQVSFADCYDLTFVGVGGSTVNAKCVLPKNLEGKKIPAVIEFHGYGWHSGEWNNKLAYAASDIAFIAVDCRGQGGKSEDLTPVRGNTKNGHIIRGLEDGPENLYFRRVFLDTAQIANIVLNMDFIDENLVFTKGESQGGALSLVCAALEPRIKKCYSIYPFLSDYRRVWEMGLDADAYGEMREFFKIMDPRHLREEYFFETLSYIDVQNLADRIKCDVLMGTGLSDNICPPSTQFAIYNKIVAEKEHLIYPDYGHEGLPGFNDIVLMDIDKICCENRK